MTNEKFGPPKKYETRNMHTEAVLTQALCQTSRNCSGRHSECPLSLSLAFDHWHAYLVMTDSAVKVAHSKTNDRRRGRSIVSFEGVTDDDDSALRGKGFLAKRVELGEKAYSEFIRVHMRACFAPHVNVDSCCSWPVATSDPLSIMRKLHRFHLSLMLDGGCIGVSDVVS